MSMARSLAGGERRAWKAFIQRLKSTERCYIVQGGSGGRPAPPAAWPRRGLGAITWPAFKLCESHTVLLVLTILAGLALVAPALWVLLWRALAALTSVV